MTEFAAPPGSARCAESARASRHGKRLSAASTRGAQPAALVTVNADMRTRRQTARLQPRIQPHANIVTAGNS